MQDIIVISKAELQKIVKEAVLEAIAISKKPMTNRFFKPEAAKYLGISVATVNKLMSLQKINYNKIGKRVVFTKEDLDLYLENTKMSNAMTVNKIFT